jgi:hypothetical protein
MRRSSGHEHHEHIVSETLRVAFRRDRELQPWLTTVHAEVTVELRNIQSEPLRSTSSNKMSLLLGIQEKGHEEPWWEW